MYSIIPSFISHKLFTVNKMNLFTNTFCRQIQKSILFHIYTHPKEETQKKTVENLCIEKKTTVYIGTVFGDSIPESWT